VITRASFVAVKIAFIFTRSCIYEKGNKMIPVEVCDLYSFDLLMDTATRLGFQKCIELCFYCFIIFGIAPLDRNC